MISRLKGILRTRETDRIEVETPGGVVYEVHLPLTVARRLPPQGKELEIRTLQVVREDSVALYGFLEAHERELFARLLQAKGLGAAKAISMLSTFSAQRLARALVEKDVAALTQVSGIGKKTAERIALELADKVEDLAVAPEKGAKEAAPAAREAVSALISLGYSFAEADEAVHRALEDGAGDGGTEELIRRALASRE